MVHINAYAEDVAIMAGKPKPLEQALQESYNTAKEIGLIINPPQKKQYK
jgi:hypothetical protein